MEENFLVQVHHKADILFFQAFNQLAARVKRILCLQGIITVVFLTLLILQITDFQTPDDELASPLLLNTLAGILGLISQLIQLSKVYRRIPVYLASAALTGHSLETEVITDFSSIQSCTSQSVYVNSEGSYLNRGDFDQSGRKKLMAITKMRITSLSKQIVKSTRTIQSLADGLSLASMGYSLYALIAIGLPPAYIVILSIYVAITCLRQLFTIFVLVLIALSPLLCLLVCIFCCFCKPEGDGQFIDLPSTKPTQANMMNCQGSCSICRTDVDENSKIYVLPCSEKHIFHTMCLSQWAKLKNTCPNCRAEIPMTNRGRDSQIIEASQNQN